MSERLLEAVILVTKRLLHKLVASARACSDEAFLPHPVSSRNPAPIASQEYGQITPGSHDFDGTPFARVSPELDHNVQHDFDVRTVDWGTRGGGSRAVATLLSFRHPQWPPKRLSPSLLHDQNQRRSSNQTSLATAAEAAAEKENYPEAFRPNGALKQGNSLARANADAGDLLGNAPGTFFVAGVTPNMAEEKSSAVRRVLATEFCEDNVDDGSVSEPGIGRGLSPCGALFVLVLSALPLVGASKGARRGWESGSPGGVPGGSTGISSGRVAVAAAELIQVTFSLVFEDRLRTC